MIHTIFICNTEQNQSKYYEARCCETRNENSINITEKCLKPSNDKSTIARL